MMIDAEFLHIADIPDAPDGYTLAANSVSDDGSGLFLFVEAGKADKVAATRGGPGGVRFPETSMPDAAATLLAVRGGSAMQTGLSGINVTFPLIDRFPDGRILVVGARAERYADGSHDLNGLVFALDGGLERRILLGDGIKDVMCDGTGRIWVSYFDEGVYGNLGWHGPDGPAPIGAAGLACFDEEGTILWNFEATDGADRRRYIDDCYAMNVKGDMAWIYFYSDFDLCRIDRGFRTRLCATDLSGCHALAVHGNQVLLTGQYDDTPDIGYLGTITDGKLSEVRQVRFGIPGLEAGERLRFIGRGATLNVFHRNTWLQHDMALLTA